VGRVQPVSLSFVSGLATPALVLYISLLLVAGKSKSHVAEGVVRHVC